MPRHLEDVMVIRFMNWDVLQTFFGAGISLRALARDLMEDGWKQVSRHLRRQRAFCR